MLCYKFCPKFPFSRKACEYQGRLPSPSILQGMRPGDRLQNQVFTTASVIRLIIFVCGA